MDDRVPTLEHGRFDVSPGRGFVPDPDPVTALDGDVHPVLGRLDRIARTLPKRLTEGSLRETLASIEPPPRSAVETLSTREARRVYGAGGFLASAYVHHGDGADHVPPGVAVPLVTAARRLGRTPMLAYDAYVLENWRRDDDGRFSPASLAVPTTFSGRRDEEWFVAVHVAIEATAGPAVAAVGEAQAAVRGDDPDRARQALETIGEAVGRVNGTLARMTEHNDPEVYGRAFRPYLMGFERVTYRGTDLEGEQSFRGGSGAQSSLFPALDGVLGIDHGDGPLVSHLRELRADMPPGHRAYVEAAEDGPTLRPYVRNRGEDGLRVAYGDCIDRLVEFRERHLDVVRTYLGAEEGTGTGGTPYVSFLEGFIEDTREARL